MHPLLISPLVKREKNANFECLHLYDFQLYELYKLSTFLHFTHTSNTSKFLLNFSLIIFLVRDNL